MMKSFRHLFAILALSLAGTSLAAQLPAEFSSSGAREQFRLGVQAYHSGRYSEAILLFEKALAFEPGESLVTYWLGRAYQKNGLSDTTIRLWTPMAEAVDAPPFFKARLEALRASRAIGGGETETATYVEAARFQGTVGKTVYFLRPSSLLPQSDGSVLVAAQGSNEILRIDPNGVIKERDRGGLKGYDRPFGLAALPDGALFVSEFNGDRVSRLGNGKDIVFGKKGRAPDQLLGPEYLTVDGEGYLYVVDYGNARVVKYDPDGGFILSFGQKMDGFPGFVSPAGIAARDGIIYVADSYRKAIYYFDPSGNYLGVMADGLLHFPEGLAFWKNGSSLLVADTDRILSLDLETQTPTVVYKSPDKKARIVGAVADRNGNLLACDFDASAVLVLTEAPQMAAGYDVSIERVDASGFPSVTMDVSVKDRLGNPVVGLAQANFRVFERVKTKTSTVERGRTVEHEVEVLAPVKGFDLSGIAGTTAPPRITILLDRSPSMEAFRQAARDAVGELYTSLKAVGATSFALVGAGRTPTLMVPGGGSLPDLTRASLAEPENAPGRFDAGLKLAVSTMLPSSAKDIVIYVGDGQVDEKSFGAMTLSELAGYLGDNDIHLFAVLLGEGRADPALRFLVDSSGGSFYLASRARGLGDLASEVSSMGSGRYRMKFLSSAEADFGEAYQAVAVEAYLYKKSGRDELGYFAPLR